MPATTLGDVCCEIQNPCEVYCLLEQAYVRRMLGETVVSMQVGGEKYTFQLPSSGELLSAKKHYAALCEQIGGQTNELRRSGWCFEFGEHACRAPAPKCGC